MVGADLLLDHLVDGLRASSPGGFGRRARRGHHHLVGLGEMEDHIADRPARGVRRRAPRFVVERDEDAFQPFVLGHQVVEDLHARMMPRRGTEGLRLVASPPVRRQHLGEVASVTRMRFGIFMAPFHPAGENPTLLLDGDLELVEHLDRLGFDEAWIGEHHSAGSETIASPEIFIAAAAQRTRHDQARHRRDQRQLSQPPVGGRAGGAARPHDQGPVHARARPRCAAERRGDDRPRHAPDARPARGRGRHHHPAHVLGGPDQLRERAVDAEGRPPPPPAVHRSPPGDRHRRGRLAGRAAPRRPLRARAPVGRGHDRRRLRRPRPPLGRHGGARRALRRQGRPQRLAPGRVDAPRRDA